MYSSVSQTKVAVSPESAQAADIFEQFLAAATFKSVLHHYRHLCEVLRLRPTNFRSFYPKLKSKLKSWKANALWSKFDKRASHKCYNHGKICTNTKILIIGGGPCGLRSAIEAQLCGAKVVVVEKRDRFSRNNVLHLWPFVISDLKALGAKKFYGKFCAGAIDHISIRQLQCILLKVALLLGVEVVECVTFEGLVEPPEDQTEKIGWRATFSPADHPVNQYEFGVLIGADGKRNTLTGFKRKEFRGKLAIAITANFINRHTEAEARVQEISGVAFIFNQKFFKDLYAATGIDLENIVYYKDETHYFVMTAKKHSLINKGVILNDYPDTQQLLHAENVDRNALLSYAREAANFSTNYQLPQLDFAVNHYGKPDIAMFDFTSMFAAENACRVVERRGHKLLMGLVGDSLLEPFWPTGSGCARGFLSSFDTCWMIRSWASGKMTTLEVLAERESIYRLLAQTTPENLNKDHSSYSLEPSSRYPTINTRTVLAFQVRNLYDTDNPSSIEEAINPSYVISDELPKKRKWRDGVHADTLLSWCKKQVALYPDIHIHNMTSSFKDGRALCAIIHRYRPDLIDFVSLRGEDIASNNQLAFDILEREFGVPPVMTGSEMAECDIPDKLSMISYISQIYDVFRGEIPHYKHPKMEDTEMALEHSHVSRRSTPHINILKNLTNKNTTTVSSVPGSISINKKRQSLDRVDKRHLVENVGLGHDTICDEDGSLGERRMDSLKKNKKRRSDKAPNMQDKLDAMSHSDYRRPAVEESQEFSDRKKGLEAKFKGSSYQSTEKKPKDMIRAIGKIEKSDWNMMALEKRAHDHSEGAHDRVEKERVPRWNKDTFDEKFTHMERRLRENGEDEETIAKYKEIDASLRKLERKLREGSTLEAGIRGQNKVTNLANQLSGKFEKKEPEQVLLRRQPSATQITLPTSGSDLCHFCGNRVYLVERLSAEGKFFHRQCFKCDYCGANLRLGNYVYDREGRFGGKFFCVPHFGLTPRFARSRRADDTDSAKENVVPNAKTATSVRSREPIGLVTATVKESVESAGRAQPVLPASALATTDSLYEKSSPAAVQSPASTTAKSTPASTPTLSLPPPQLRGTTPERVEFENSLVEQSDEEYLSEDEWTDRNFGASANELDDTSDDEDSDYSDLSDEEVEGEEMEFIEGGGTLTADQTRRLAESWRRRYSTDNLDDYDNDEVGRKLYHDSESDLDSDGMSEDYCAEGDESHTATEGEGCEDEDEEEECEQVRRAREIRRQEVNINVSAPPRKAETSDSGSETEVASDEESEDSDTQIDTDSEFAEDPPPPSEIPKIVINESNDPSVDHEGTGKFSKKPVESSTGMEKKTASLPHDQYIEQRVDLGTDQTEANDRVRDGPEKSASMTNLPDKTRVNPHTEQLKRLFQRTESTEAIAARKSLELKKQYLLGNTPMSPKKSVSTADLGDRFKSFMNKISETQKMLNPAPQPSASMQAYMNSAQKPPVSSPSSPLLPLRSTSLPQGSSDSSKDAEVCVAKESKKVSITTPVESSVFPVNETHTIKPCIEAQEDHLKEIKVEEEVEELSSFPVVLDKLSCKDSLNQSLQVQKGVIKVENSSDSSSHTSETASDYDNVPSTRKRSVINHSVVSPSVMQLEDKSPNILQSNLSISLVNQTTLDVKVPDMKENEAFEDKIDDVKKAFEVDQHPSGTDLYEDFGICESLEDGVEAVNKELVIVNAPRSLECQTFEELERAKEGPVRELGDVVSNSFNMSADEDLSFVDEKFEELYSDAMVQSNELVSKSDLGESISNKFSAKEASNFSNKVTGDLDFSKSPSVSDVVICSDMTESPKDLESDVSHKSPKKELSSPESKEALLTETELSDWAGDNVGIFSAGEDIDTDLRHFRLKKQNAKGPVARIASMESLGDTDSAISTATSGPTKTGSSLVKPAVLGNLDGIEFMDTSDSGTSSDEAPHRKQGYRKLGEETPTTPVAPQILSATEDQCKMVFRDSEERDSLEAKTSDETSTEMENSRNNSVNESVNNNDSLKGRKAKWGIKNGTDPQTIGNYEPPSSSEPEIKQDSESRLDSLDDYMSPKRYEGYIPRFKDRMSPFGLARDSIDVKKNSAKKPLFTPSKTDIEERKKNETEMQKQLLSLDTRNQRPPSPDTSRKQITDRMKKKGQDGDVIRDMVMSRISRKTPEKTGRRGSRTSLSPLPSTGSRTSLFSPQSSQENLLERGDSSTITPSEESSVMNGEVKSNTSALESRDIRKSGIFEVRKDEKQAGNRLDISEKGKEISSCSEGTISLSQPGVSDSSISFGDNSDEVFKTETEPIIVKPYFSEDQTLVTKSLSIVTRPENSMPDNFKPSLPSTSLIHPEKFQNNNNSHLKQELFKSLPASAQTKVVTCHTSVPQVPLSSLRKEVDTEMANTVNRENARETARHKARLLSDKDLGLSPPDLAENLREKLRRESEGDKEDKVKERIEEYRQKCQEGVRASESEKRERIVRRHPHRPSLLQLESLQVFTSPERHASASNITSTSSASLGNVSTVAVSPLHQLGGSSSNVHVEKSKSHQHLPLQTESIDPKGVENQIESWKQENMAPDKTPQDGAKKSGKRSKDRERRRSLIQVFAGMFGKSEDKKKSSSQSAGDTAETSTVSNSQGRLLSASTEPISPKQSNIPPKSPATVREKLAKLRLSRTKEKNKAMKKRSSSADVVDGSSSSEWNRSAMSLPTSPSHHPHSAHSSFYSQQQDAAPHASEESLSDDDGASASCTPGTTLERTGTATLASGGGSISKRQRAFRKAARQAELKRLRMAQEIQRQLEECEVKTRELEEKGVSVEKGLRGEPGFSGLDETELMSEWFSLVHEKNALIRWEQELMVRAKELELEDRHVRLEQELRERMALSEHDKSRQDIDREGIILAEMLSILEQKDALVQMQEEDRLRYVEEDRDLEAVMLRKGLQLTPYRRETDV